MSGKLETVSEDTSKNHVEGAGRKRTSRSFVQLFTCTVLASSKSAVNSEFSVEPFVGIGSVISRYSRLGRWSSIFDLAADGSKYVNYAVYIGQMKTNLSLDCECELGYLPSIS